jgi:hypothetical protein
LTQILKGLYSLFYICIVPVSAEPVDEKDDSFEEGVGWLVSGIAISKE